MKKFLLLTTILLFAFFVNAQVSKTVDVITAGTLRNLLTTTEMTTVTNLAVTGIIDARDFRFMRDGITNLAVLDISAVTIQAYTGTGGTSTISSYPTNEMPLCSFYNNVGKTSLKNVILPNSVESIGDYTFTGCSGLTSITIGNSVTSIGNCAFNGCRSLTSFTIPNSVTTIGQQAFSYCTQIKNITIPNSVISIGGGFVFGCSSLTSITIPNSVITMGWQAFDGCSSLISITIGNSVTSIEQYSFSGCSSLTCLIIGSSVTSIAEAFDGCKKLNSIYTYATVPIVLSSNPFSSVNIYACTLYVPAGSKSLYQAAPIWGDFNIVEMAPTALHLLTSESVTIYPNPVTEGFQINGLEGTGTVTLINLSGKIILTKQVEANDYISIGSLPKGVYIAKIKTAKGFIERKFLKY